MDELPILTTGRLRLRGLCATDAPALFAVLSDPRVTRFYDIPTFTELREATAHLERIAAQSAAGEAMRWGITVADCHGDLVVGTCGFHGMNVYSGTASVGYDLAAPSWGRGIMTEAMSAVVAHGFRHLGLSRLTALTRLEHAASMRVLQKLGFADRGPLLPRQTNDGHGQGLRGFLLTREEWENRATERGLNHQMGV